MNFDKVQLKRPDGVVLYSQMVPPGTSLQLNFRGEPLFLQGELELWRNDKREAVTSEGWHGKWERSTGRKVH